MTKTHRPAPVGLFAVGILLVVGFFVLGGADLISGEPSDPSTASTQVDYRFSTLEPIDVDELQPEALNTLDLILDGGPFPFDRDDTVFQNREGLLPDHAQGYYREYTVITPGENDRGARRIVAGADGDLYYTNDHYQSFREIVGGNR